MTRSLRNGRLHRRHRPPGGRGSGVGLAWLALGALLFFAPAITSLTHKSATYDEPVYVVAGLSYLSLHDYTLKEDAPPLVAYLAGVSPLLHGLRIPNDRLGFSDSLGREYDFSTRVLYRSGLDADLILLWSRLAVLLPFGLLLLATVLLWATALFGTRAGVFALLLTALSPNLIAHGRLVAADFPCAATLLFSSFLLWRYAESPTQRRALGVGLGLGLALVTKFTALLLLPCFALIFALLAWRRAAPLRDLARDAGLVALPALGAVCLIYGLPPDPLRYVDGVRAVYRNIDSDYFWYALGSFYLPGLPWYYVATLAVKTSAPLLALGLASLLWIPRRNTGIVSEMCLFLPAIALLVASADDGFNAGVRRVLPVLPVLAISASRFAVLPSGRSWREARGLMGLALLGTLLAWHSASSLRTWPHYIPYFNELAGGRDRGPDLLDDANLDFGQDLAALPEVLERHGIRRVNLAYHGTADPAFYGIRYHALSYQEIEEPGPGIYAVSLHFLIRLRMGPGRPRALVEARPFDRAGTSIWLFRVEAPEQRRPGRRRGPGRPTPGR